MNMRFVEFSNELPPSSKLASVKDYLSEETLQAPVDMFHRSLREILNYGGREVLEDSDFLGRLLTLGLISSAEAYFRSVLSSCIEMCPIAQAHASKQNISLGGVIWHGRDGFSRSAFEHSSFASKEDLTSACKKFLNHNLEDSKYRSILEEYENVCQIRHAIVHNDGILPGKNAVQLNIPRYQNPVRIVLRYSHIQEIASVVNSLVMTFNRDLFELMCRRWAVEWRKREDWEPALEARRFKSIWRLFHCAEECKRRRGRSSITLAKCCASVRQEYNI